MNRWIISCNIRFFDVISHFSKDKEIVWRRIGNINQGDEVFIYLAAPYKEIRYKAVVLDADVSENEVSQRYGYAIPEYKPMKGRVKYMRLLLQESFSEGVFSLEALQTVGLTQTRGQSKLPASVVKYILEHK